MIVSPELMVVVEVPMNTCAFPACLIGNFNGTAGDLQMEAMAI